MNRYIIKQRNVGAIYEWIHLIKKTFDNNPDAVIIIMGEIKQDKKAYYIKWLDNIGCHNVVFETFEDISKGKKLWNWVTGRMDYMTTIHTKIYIKK